MTQAKIELSNIMRTVQEYMVRNALDSVTVFASYSGVGHAYAKRGCELIDITMGKWEHEDANG